MRWWILSILFICPLFTAISLPVVPSRQQPLSNWLTLLHLTECELPCWIGITPGETTVGEAQKQIAATYGDSSLYILNMEENLPAVVTYKPTGYQLNIAFHSDTGEITAASIVREIYLQPFIRLDGTINSPPISSLQSILGNPEMVRLASGDETPTITLIYEGGLVHEYVNDSECDKILPNQQLISIVLFDQIPVGWAWLSDPQEWHGFSYCYNFVRKVS